MTVLLKIDKKDFSNKDVILFGARQNYSSINHGQSVGYTTTVIDCCDDYLKLCGGFNFNYGSYTAFLMDCVKHNFTITQINRKAIFDTDEKSITINPYNDTYTISPTKEHTILELTLELK